MVATAPVGRAIFEHGRIGGRGPFANPVVRLGFTLFGRWTQLRFYDRTLARMEQMVVDRAER